MRLMSGYSNNKGNCPLHNINIDYANELNNFYNRFDTHDFSAQIVTSRKNSLSEIEMQNPFLQVTEQEVFKSFSRINSLKAAGPNMLSPFVLNNCSRELAPIFTHLFSKCISSQPANHQHVEKLLSYSTS